MKRVKKIILTLSVSLIIVGALGSTALASPEDENLPPILSITSTK
ncbi:MULTISPECIES: hypothetical protein [Bacillaceae]|nr:MULTISPECIES: hypothetical protein [Bacillaceae]MDX8360964.1 hypothetical protein [Cytobacillus sp. IB215316]